MALATRVSSLQRDAMVFMGGIVLFLIGVWVAMSYGVSFGPGGGVAVWAVGLVLVVALVFGATVWWWFYVPPGSREPARGEFTSEAGHLRAGAGSFRTKPMREAHTVSEEPHLEHGVAYNRGVSRRLVFAASLALAVGLLLRLAGMLGALGSSQIPMWVDVVLTVLGGIVAFGAFLVLDTA